MKTKKENAEKWVKVLIGKLYNGIPNSVKIQIEEAGLCAVVSVQGLAPLKIGETFNPKMKKLASSSLSGYLTDGAILDVFIFGYEH